jgi:GNAT superfamily N-acetyltransferase
MNFVRSSVLTADQKLAASLLWNQEYPHQVMMENLTDFDNYLSELTEPEHLLYMPDELLGWAFKFMRDGEKWFAIILDSSIHQQGIGTLLMEQLKENEEELNGWVIDHDQYKKTDAATYRSPLQFYLKNGFTVLEDFRLKTIRLQGVKIRWNRSRNV